MMVDKNSEINLSNSKWFSSLLLFSFNASDIDSERGGDPDFSSMAFLDRCSFPIDSVSYELKIFIALVRSLIPSDVALME